MIEQKLTIDPNELQSKVINLLRFPLIVAIVLIHTHLNDLDGSNFMYNQDYPFMSTVIYVISGLISGTVALPCFFFISGFLFFLSTKEDYNFSFFIKKFKRRIRSLVLPYLIWNMVLFIVYLLASILLPVEFFGKYKLDDPFSLNTLCSIFWNVNGTGYPIDGPLWYIRDLIILVILSPLIYIFIRKMGVLSILILTVIYIFPIPKINITGFMYEGFLFFSVGAFFSINKLKFLCKNKWYNILPYCGLAFCIILVLVFRNYHWFPYGYFLKMIIILGIISIFNFSSLLIRRYNVKPNPLLNNSNFFIYAYHYFPIIFFIKVLIKLFYPMTEFKLLLIYLVSPFIVISVGVLLFYMLNKYFPQFTKILTGGR